MKLEDLTKEGLTEEQANKVLALHKKAIDGNYVPKTTFEAERGKLKTANETIEDRDKQITELGKFKGTAEELQKKVDTLTTQNATDKKEYEDKLLVMEQDGAIRAEVGDTVYSVDDIMPKLDKTKIVFKDGKVVAGLKEQMKEIQKTYPHYFKETDKGGLPSGWTPFGRSPDESRKHDGSDTAAEFGKALAKSQAESVSSTKKANDIYFK